MRPTGHKSLFQQDISRTLTNFNQTWQAHVMLEAEDRFGDLLEASF